MDDRADELRESVRDLVVDALADVVRRLAEEEIRTVEERLERATATIEGLESLRPHWAQGYSSDAVAASVATIALSSLWTMLGARDQTAAVRNLAELLRIAAGERTAPSSTRTEETIRQDVLDGLFDEATEMAASLRHPERHRLKAKDRAQWIRDIGGMARTQRAVLRLSLSLDGSATEA